MNANKISCLKTPYIKPQLIELNSAMGTEGMADMMSGTKGTESNEGNQMSIS